MSAASNRSGRVASPLENRPPLPRASGWGGVWAGFVVGAGLATLLSLLLAALAASMIEPADDGLWPSVVSGTAIVTGLALLVAVYIGAWMAAKLSATTRREGMGCGLAVGILAITLQMVLSAWMTRAVTRYGSADGRALLALLPRAGFWFALCAFATAMLGGARGGRSNQYPSDMSSYSELSRELDVQAASRAASRAA